MGSPVTWARYFLTRIRSSVAQSIRSYEVGDIHETEIYQHIYKNLTEGSRLTFKRLVKGTEMTPTFAAQGETLLIRSLPRPSSRSVFVGDVVMLKDPQNPERELVRRVAALEGEEMESSDPNDEPFRLDRGTCWVLCDNEELSPKVPVWIYLPSRIFHFRILLILNYWGTSSSVYLLGYYKLRIPNSE
ncbi:hypothetical protein KC19_4G257000 [Ceratodon purpureus]|uniref:Peptidase S26 domain-containing protein n=1 Tax=Ceratodon purpureus TaxID=3225 RepID=A0A8T0IF07_CERPU|nr:hypothetical protein KC19_4G257000 [Ceratodon purpureus]KAG0581499.1 hypothetical protein KC19_4G257000 [Ceratodon purpureus]